MPMLPSKTHLRFVTPLEVVVARTSTSTAACRKYGRRKNDAVDDGEVDEGRGGRARGAGKQSTVFCSSDKVGDGAVGGKNVDRGTVEGWKGGSWGGLRGMASAPSILLALAVWLTRSAAYTSGERNVGGCAGDHNLSLSTMTSRRNVKSRRRERKKMKMPERRWDGQDRGRVLFALGDLVDDGQLQSTKQGTLGTVLQLEDAPTRRVGTCEVLVVDVHGGRMICACGGGREERSEESRCLASLSMGVKPPKVPRSKTHIGCLRLRRKVKSGFMIRSAGYYLPVAVRLSATAAWNFVTTSPKSLRIIQGLHKQIQSRSLRADS
ncbi:hypothetical protein DFH06DRAFT_1123511 [Mycena polygramma]|nr:hypothetical protein DFH06DRAFT_1123511 [Mycena polygramma]